MRENLERDGESILAGLMQRVQLKSSLKKFRERTKRDEMREGERKGSGGAGR